MTAKVARGGYREFVRRLSRRWDVPFDTALLLYRDLVAEMQEMVSLLEPIRFQGFGVINPEVVRRKWGRAMSFYACPLCDTGVKATPLHVLKHGLTFREFCAIHGEPYRGDAELRSYLITPFRLYADEYKRVISSSPLKELMEEEEEKLHGEADGEPPHIG